jgi:hypothetical protein
MLRSTKLDAITKRAVALYNEREAMQRKRVLERPFDEVEKETEEQLTRVLDEIEASGDKPILINMCGLNQYARNIIRSTFNIDRTGAYIIIN